MVILIINLGLKLVKNTNNIPTKTNLYKIRMKKFKKVLKEKF